MELKSGRMGGNGSLFLQMMRRRVFHWKSPWTWEHLKLRNDWVKYFFNRGRDGGRNYTEALSTRPCSTANSTCGFSQAVWCLSVLISYLQNGECDNITCATDTAGSIRKWWEENATVYYELSCTCFFGISLSTQPVLIISKHPIKTFGLEKKKKDTGRLTIIPFT